MAKVQMISKAEAKRLVLGLSYEQVAQKAALPVSTVRYYLKSGAPKSIRIGNEIAKALDDSINIFLPTE